MRERKKKNLFLRPFGEPCNLATRSDWIVDHARFLEFKQFMRYLNVLDNHF